MLLHGGYRIVHNECLQHMEIIFGQQEDHERVLWSHTLVQWVCPKASGKEMTADSLRVCYLRCTKTIDWLTYGEDGPLSGTTGHDPLLGLLGWRKQKREESIGLDKQYKEQTHSSFTRRYRTANSQQ